MARNLEQLRAMVVLTTKAFEPSGTAPQDRWHDRDTFHIVDRSGATVKPCTCRKRRFQAGLALFAFKAFDHRGFFAANICTSAAMNKDVEVITGLGGVLAE